MKRWNAGLAGVLLLAAALAGCKQRVYLTDADFDSMHYTKDLGLPRNAEYDPLLSLAATQLDIAKPTDVNDPDRPLRYISLSEAIAIALEQGNVGSQSALFPGIQNDNLVQFSGRLVGLSDSIRVLALDPAIVGADIEQSLAKFDARWLSSMTWNKRDDAIGNVLQNFQTGDNANFSTGMYKPLPTGGLAGITITTEYSFLNQPPQFQTFTNPSYRPRVQFNFEQPLLQGFGVEYNMLAITHPGSVSVPGLRPQGGRTEGVLITRLRYDQSKTEFERGVNFMLLNVEFAYWNLYGAYFALFSREQGVRQAYESYKITKARVDAGALKPQELEQNIAQYEQFRAQRIATLDEVLDRERQLRGLLGLPIEDGTRIVPSDTPTLAAFAPDWKTALDDMMQYRPELILARQELKFRQLDIIQQKNFLKPDLRFFANYDVNGLGTRLDGSPVNGTDIQGNDIPGNALASLTDNVFNSWTIGLRLDVPLGNREAFAAVRTSKLNLTRSYYQLKDQERKATSFLAVQVRRLARYYAEIEANRAQREASARELALRFQEFIVGSRTIDILLESQRRFADSLAAEHQSIVNYNNALAGYQFAKGTLMTYDSVVITDGPLPSCAQVRAVEHQRQRTAALVARERPAVIMNPEMTCAPKAGELPSIAALQKSEMALPKKEAPVEKLPMPKKEE